MICSLAGPEAERCFTGTYNSIGAGGDNQGAAEIASRATAHYQEWLDAAQARTVELVEQEWPAIVAVAEALESARTLSAPAIRKIVHRTRR